MSSTVVSCKPQSIFDSASRVGVDRAGVDARNLPWVRLGYLTVGKTPRLWVYFVLLDYVTGRDRMFEPGGARKLTFYVSTKRKHALLHRELIHKSQHEEPRPWTDHRLRAKNGKVLKFPFFLHHAPLFFNGRSVVLLSTLPIVFCIMRAD